MVRSNRADLDAGLAEKSNTVVEEDDPPADTTASPAREIEGPQSQEPAARKIKVQGVQEVEPCLVPKVRHVHSNSRIG